MYVYHASLASILILDQEIDSLVMILLKVRDVNLYTIVA
jgi:hypothetical protein